MNNLVYISTYCVVLASQVGIGNEAKKVTLDGVVSYSMEKLFTRWASLYQNLVSKHFTLKIGTKVQYLVAIDCLKSNQCHVNRRYNFIVADSNIDVSSYADFNKPLAVPLLSSLVSFVHTIPGVNLSLTPNDLVDIYSGTIDRWNHPQLLLTTPSLPDEPIKLIARMDSSKATQVVTELFSFISPTWNKTHGTFSDPGPANNSTWGRHIYAYAYGTIGVVGSLASNPYSLSYLPWAIMTSYGLPPVAVPDLNISPLNPHTQNTQYEGLLKSDMYILIDAKPNGRCEETTELVRFIRWILGSKAALIAIREAAFVPFSSEMAQSVDQIIMSSVSCSGQSIKSLIDEVIASETPEPTQTKTISSTLGSLIVVIVAVAMLLAYVGYRFHVRRKIASKSWLLNQREMYLIEGQDKLGSRSTLLDMQNWLDAASHESDVLKEETSTRKNRRIGRYYGNPVILFRSKNAYFDPVDYDVKTSKLLHKFTASISHENLLKFVGLFVEGEEPNKHLYFAHSHGKFKGWLHWVLKTSRYVISEDVRMVLARDIAKGMQLLHENEIIHGSLSSATCYLDSNWCIKIGDWAECSVIQSAETPDAWSSVMREKFQEAYKGGQIDDSLRLLIQYTDPALFASPSEQLVTCTKVHDVYSYGLLLGEIFTATEPYADIGNESFLAFIKRLIGGQERPPLPPDLPMLAGKIAIKCVDPNRPLRPTFEKILDTLESGCSNLGRGIVETLMKSMEAYMTSLEQKIEERTKDLKLVTTRMEKLLCSMLPPEIAKKLEQGHKVHPEFYEETSVYFSDIVGFTTICSVSTPLQVIEMLNGLYTHFDEVIDSFDVYKVETIGDAYMVVSGLPRRNGHEHARHITAMSLDLVNVVRSFVIKHTQKHLQIRVGINSGPCMAGVVGLKMPRYCLFGDTVNVASRMESTSLPMKIHASDHLIQYLKNFPEFSYEIRGFTEIKGKGRMATYWITDSRKTPTPPKSPKTIWEDSQPT